MSMKRHSHVTSLMMPLIDVSQPHTSTLMQPLPATNLEDSHWSLRDDNWWSDDRAKLSSAVSLTPPLHLKFK